MAGGTIALIGWLGLVSLALIVVSAGIVVSLFDIAPAGEDADGLHRGNFWASLMRTLDSGHDGRRRGLAVPDLIMLAGDPRPASSSSRR